ncbi:MAG: trigger factor [Clostridia bacterium]|nr:trigger factor [Clostridia bacterium]
MKLVNKTEVEKNVVELEISVPADEFEAAVQASYRKNVGKVNVPGFRRGKAPRKIVEKMYGEGFFWNDAVDALYPDAYEAAVKEAGITPVDRANVEITEIAADKGFTFKAKVTVKPEVNVKEYKGLKVEKPSTEVTDEDIANEIAGYQRRNSRMIDVDDRAAELDDTVTFDFEGFTDGKPFEGGKASDYTLKLGSGQFIPGFEDQMVGKKIDEEFTVNVTFPEEYHADELKGQPAEFKCCIHKIQKEELPEVDDEFVKDISDFDTLDEFKADLSKKIAERKEAEADRVVSDKLAEAVADLVEADIPDCMFENEINASVNDFAQRMASQGMNMEQYMQITGAKMEDLRNMFAARAQVDVKLRLALEKIAELEGVVISDEDVNAEYEKFSKEMQVPVERIKSDSVTENIIKELATAKAFECVKAHAEMVAEGAKKTAKKPAAKKAPAKKAETAEETAPEKKPTAKKTASTAAKKPAAKKTPAKKAEAGEEAAPEKKPAAKKTASTAAKSTATKAAAAKSAATKSAATKKPAAKKPAAKKDAE